jgi:hypothetical protein
MAVAGMALSVAALAAPRERDQAAPGMAYISGAGFEAGSVLLTTPHTGASVLIWSLDDGVGRKLVWSRFSEKQGWSAPRAMTFGIGDDLAPTAGISSTGSVLYWVDDREQVFFAPFDPETGSLHAVPRPISFGGLSGRRPSVEGGNDGPIILSVCDPTNPVEPCLPSTPAAPGGPGREEPPHIAPEGGGDVPIIVSVGGTQSSGLMVASHPGCRGQILAAAAGDTISVMAFDGAGRSSLLGHFRILPGTDRNAAASTLGVHYLRATCR